MKRAVILDFYGTVVHEAYALLDEIAVVFHRCGASCSVREIHRLWWQNIASLCDEAHGENFRNQKTLYFSAFENMEKQTGVTVDKSSLVKAVIEFSLTTEPFEDALKFLQDSPLPCFILSNIDTDELYAMINKHSLKVKDFYTSEEAREYKPRKGIFEKGLKKFGLKAEEAVYVGDSLRNDYFGARGAGIDSVWLNRLNAEIPNGVISCPDFNAVLPLVLRQGFSKG